MPPTVSVVIPMHNDGAWIGETLQSVYRQTYPLENIELVAVDDASSDESASIVRAFLRDHSMRGHVIARERNAGASAARNAGWQQAAGEWIQFLDADDLLAPRKIEVQLSWATQLPDDVAVVYSTWQYFGLHDGQWRPQGSLVASSVDDDTVARILIDRAFGYVGPTLMRKSSVQGATGFNERLDLGEDIDLMLRLAMAGARFSRAPSDDALFFYRQRKGSLWRQRIASVDSLRNLVYVWRRAELHLREQRASDLSEEVCQALARRYALALDVTFEQDRECFRETLEWIRQLGLRYPPDPRRSMQLVAPILGYETAHRLLASYRRARGAVRALRKSVRR
jgi:glycosyltransferase involved in cell wall biosynthesis